MTLIFSVSSNAQLTVSRLNISDGVAPKLQDDHLDFNITNRTLEEQNNSPGCVDIRDYRNPNWSSPSVSVREWHISGPRDCRRASSKALQPPPGWTYEDDVVFYDRGYPPPSQYPKFKKLATPFGVTEGVVCALRIAPNAIVRYVCGQLNFGIVYYCHCYA